MSTPETPELPETLIIRSGFSALAARLTELGSRRVLVLCGPNRRAVDGALAAFADLSPEVFDGARVHVPAAVVDLATARLAATEADTIVAIGGGSAIGLGKALRLSSTVRFAAVPTTYAGSEMTTMYGITRDRDKQTGRDPRVRPDLVLYDATLLRDMSVALTTQSLFNALAHVISIASTGTHTPGALAAAHDVLRSIEDLLLVPTAYIAREHAARAASDCARAFDRGTPGAQHAIAHLLGGALGLDHAALHAMLLPQFVAHLRSTDVAALAAIERALDRTDLDAYLHDLLVRAGAPVALTALGASADAVRAALATKPELPGEIAEGALHGLRPSGRGGRIAVGSPLALLAGPPPARARRIVLALHGRGSEAGTIVRRMREIAGHDPEVSVIGLRADDGADRWYGIRYGDAGAGAHPEVVRALDRVDAAIGAIGPRDKIVLAGFSQGACLALEYAARRGAGLAGVIAPCGARIGRPAEWARVVTGSLARLPILVGAAIGDKWVARADIDATAAWFRMAGATVDVIDTQGDRHEITARQRLAARVLVLGVARAPVQRGFGNTFETASLPNALPEQQNSPRRGPYGLYPEQLNGTGFTAPRADNRRTWCYRIRPSAQRRPFRPLLHARIASAFGAPEINLCGFAPLAEPAGEADFVDGLVTLCGAGDARDRRGYAIHRYAANRSMERRAFYDADGDLVIVPEHGALTLLTELGPLELAPGSIAIIPCGIVFSVLLHDPTARGYVAESFGRHFRLPERGPVGANGLADARHFRAPSAWHEDRLVPDFRIVGKLGGTLHEASQDHSPFDVVAWHGNHAPLVYDLAAFSPVANARVDHGDPSIYTVVSAPLDEQGAHTLDLVIFPERHDLTTGTFRPPFFHRNAVAEINGIVREPGGGLFVPGGCFITPPLTAHGVSGRAVEKSRLMTDAEADRPVHLGGSSGLWFQFESALAPSLTPWADPIDDWSATWGSHRSYFET